MSVLFGHPGGNPFAYNAAQAHFEAGRLEAFCIPWMPLPGTLRLLEFIKPLRNMAARLGRRHFLPLAEAPKIQGRAGELRRLLIRTLGWKDGDRLANEANDWLMRTMQRECRRVAVTAVHAYEDCSLWQFEEAKRLGKACLYDMPIGYYPAWERLGRALAEKYSDWILPGAALPETRKAQKPREMELADVVMVPSRFVADSIHEFHPYKRVTIAAYGVDLTAWAPRSPRDLRDDITFLSFGQCSIRKGVPLLL